MILIPRCAQTNGGTLVPLLVNEGYCVSAPTYGVLDLPWPVSALGGMTGVTNIVLQDGCSQAIADHLGIVADPRAAYMLDALDPQHSRPVPCTAG
ncbi:hypothetical protein ACFTS5_17950 [Nocardia sp. NPDC056952]|uniref:hypothetical protein n=1 Tax=Nocardia sp. NPDC056952 TaxID=3345979 RepID=UPI0036319774